MSHHIVSFLASWYKQNKLLADFDIKTKAVHGATLLCTVGSFDYKLHIYATYDWDCGKNILNNKLVGL